MNWKRKPQAAVTLRHLLSGSCNSGIAFEVKRIVNKCLLSHEALRVQVRSRSFLHAYIVRSKSNVHGYAVAQRRIIAYNAEMLRYVLLGLIRDAKLGFLRDTAESVYCQPGFGCYPKYIIGLLPCHIMAQHAGSLKFTLLNTNS